VTVAFEPGPNADASTVLAGLASTTPPPVVPPTVTAIAPATGGLLGGDVCTVTGTGFTGATACNFGANAGTAFSVTSDTEIAVTSPPGVAGVVDIVVAHPNGNGTGTGLFTYA
jgi:hypothetical protein